MSQYLYPNFSSVLKQEYKITEEEFNLYEKFIDYDYIEDKLKLSVALTHSKDRYGVVIRMADEASCKMLKESIRTAQEYLIFKTKDQLCNLL